MVSGWLTPNLVGVSQGGTGVGLKTGGEPLDFPVFLFFFFFSLSRSGLGFRWCEIESFPPVCWILGAKGTAVDCVVSCLVEL